MIGLDKKIKFKEQAKKKSLENFPYNKVTGFVTCGVCLHCLLRKQMLSSNNLVPPFIRTSPNLHGR